jgi:phage anti-repressor protein
MNLPDFLKKYSTIPNQFINDFFSLYDYKTNDTDMIIELDNLAKWIGMRKDNLKKTLERTYIKDIDYKIKIIKSNGKGRPTEEIMITPECMKRMCMLSSSAKSEEVRSYFIKIEKLIDKYKQVIIDDLNKKIGILENNQKPKLNPKKGVIYVIRTRKTTDDMFKIGRSKKFLARLMSHNSIDPDDIEILLLYETDNIVQVENCVKNALKSKQYRKRKEIFQVDMDTIKTVVETCDELISKVKHAKQSKSKLNKQELDTMSTTLLQMKSDKYIKDDYLQLRVPTKMAFEIKQKKKTKLRHKYIKLFSNNLNMKLYDVSE